MRISDGVTGYQFTTMCGRCPQDSPLSSLHASIQGGRAEDAFMREQITVLSIIHPHARMPRHATPRRSTRILQGSADKTGFCDSRFKVMDDDAFQKDRMISWACYRLDRFPEGLQLLPLRGIEGKLTGGKLLVSSKIVYK
jgi:hypothetical protein